MFLCAISYFGLSLLGTHRRRKFLAKTFRSLNPYCEKVVIVIAFRYDAPQRPSGHANLSGFPLSYLADIRWRTVWFWRCFHDGSLHIRCLWTAAMLFDSHLTWELLFWLQPHLSYSTCRRRRAADSHFSLCRSRYFSNCVTTVSCHSGTRLVAHALLMISDCFNEASCSLQRSLKERIHSLTPLNLLVRYLSGWQLHLLLLTAIGPADSYRSHSSCKCVLSRLTMLSHHASTPLVAHALFMITDFMATHIIYATSQLPNPRIPSLPWLNLVVRYLLTSQRHWLPPVSPLTRVCVHSSYHGVIPCCHEAFCQCYWTGVICKWLTSCSVYPWNGFDISLWYTGVRSSQSRY